MLQTSKNFLAPSQLTLLQRHGRDRRGRPALRGATTRYFADLQAQVRSDDHYIVAPGDGGRNTIFTVAARRRPTRDTDDTIVDRMDEIDCSEGGSPSGSGLDPRRQHGVPQRARGDHAQARGAARAQGCDDRGDRHQRSTATSSPGWSSAGIRVRPFFLRAASPRAAGDRAQQVLARRRDQHAHRRAARRLVYAGSSNWRGDQQRSDDLLLRIADDGVYARLQPATGRRSASRAASDQTPPATDTKPPASALDAPAGAERGGLEPRRRDAARSRRATGTTSRTRGCSGCTSR